MWRNACEETWLNFLLILFPWSELFFLLSGLFFRLFDYFVLFYFSLIKYFLYYKQKNKKEKQYKTKCTIKRFGQLDTTDV